MGVDFRKYLDDEVRKCDVVLVLIGEQWVHCVGEGGHRRLDDPRDFVRLEIESALAREIPVIPVLVGQAHMPSPKALPLSLSDLAYRQAAEVRPGRDFRSHLVALVKAVARCSRTSRAIPNVLSPQFMENPEPRLEICSNMFGMKFIEVPEGEFLMGAPTAGEDYYTEEWETPQHTVRLTRPFLLGSYPVTQSEYQRVMNANPSQFCGDVLCPVESVSWYEAVEFCNRLSHMESTAAYYEMREDGVAISGGTGYRLPTEAEWEYACRAGTTTRWHFGDDRQKLEQYAWCGKRAEGTTHRVGTKKPNAWQLYDTYGNVWEWCWDWFDDGFYNQSPTTDPTGPLNGVYRVIRGGSFAQSTVARSSKRARIMPTDHSPNIGFRVARSLDVT